MSISISNILFFRDVTANSSYEWIIILTREGIFRWISVRIHSFLNFVLLRRKCTVRNTGVLEGLSWAGELHGDVWVSLFCRLFDLFVCFLVLVVGLPTQTSCASATGAGITSGQQRPMSQLSNLLLIFLWALEVFILTKWFFAAWLSFTISAIVSHFTLSSKVREYYCISSLLKIPTVGRYGLLRISHTLYSSTVCSAVYISPIIVTVGHFSLITKRMAYTFATCYTRILTYS